ncbi:DUF563 domain-containing protein [Seiridium cupressi]
MGLLVRRLVLMKTTQIGLAVITILLILMKVNQLRYEPQIPTGILVSGIHTPSQPEPVRAAAKENAESGPDWPVAVHGGGITVEVINESITTEPTITQTKTLEHTVTTTVSVTPSVVAISHEPLPVPDEYTYRSTQSDFCIDRFTTKYLDLLRDGMTGYCSTKDASSSSLTCFHTPKSLHTDAHVDSFCIGQDVRFDKHSKLFHLDCARPEKKPAVPLTSLHGYWYGTGPQYIFNEYMKVQVRNSTGVKASKPVAEDPASRNFTILLKREGSNNIFHSLHEIMSLAYTMDVLRMSRDSKTGEAFFKSPEDHQSTQVVILDDHPEGPYYDLWQLFSNQKPIRIQELIDQNPEQPLESLGNVIVPLAGAANPIWHDDWEKHGCVNEIRRTFVRRVLELYEIKDDRNQPPSRQLTMTIVDRKETRRLFNLGALVNTTRRAYPDIKVQVIDWAALPFKRQIEIARGTDILVGIHGAGMTQALFMNEGRGAMVEIMPDTGINCFHAIAMERNLHYFRAHGKVAEAKDDWHNEDVLMDEDKFMLLVDHAVKSLYNRPGRFRDLYQEESSSVH